MIVFFIFDFVDNNDYEDKEKLIQNSLDYDEEETSCVMSSFDDVLVDRHVTQEIYTIYPGKLWSYALIYKAWLFIFFLG